MKCARQLRQGSKMTTKGQTASVSQCHQDRKKITSGQKKGLASCQKELQAMT